MIWRGLLPHFWVLAALIQHNSGPTAPFIQAIDFERGLDILNQSGTDFAFYVTSFAFPIQRAIKLTNHGLL